MIDRQPGRGTEWMRPITERFSPTIRNLVVAQSILYGLFVFANPLRALTSMHLALGPLVAIGEFWQPASALFVHLDFLSYLFDMIGLWFVGASMERILGRTRFLIIFLGAGLAANGVIAAFIAGLHWPALYAGCGDSVLALFVALGVSYGRTQVRVLGPLVLQARVLAAIFVGMAVLTALSQASWPSLCGTLVAVAVGYFVAGGKTRWISDFFGNLRRQRRGGFQVLDGGRGKQGKKYVN